MSLSATLPAQPSAEAWATLLENVLTEFDCVSGTLHRLDPSDGLLKLVASVRIPEALLPIISTIAVGKGIAGAAAERREPVELCNLQTDTSGVAKDGAKQTQVQGSIAVPALAGDILCGTLGIGKRVPYDFTSEEKAKLLALASDIAERLRAAA
jgi:signal transduction protein with GAF and PtsI domain